MPARRSSIAGAEWSVQATARHARDAGLTRGRAPRPSYAAHLRGRLRKLLPNYDVDYGLPAFILIKRPFILSCEFLSLDYRMLSNS